VDLVCHGEVRLFAGSQPSLINYKDSIISWEMSI